MVLNGYRYGFCSSKSAARSVWSGNGGNAYIVGGTSSTNFLTTTNALYSTFGGTNDTFIAKISLEAQPSLQLAQVGNDLQLSWRAFAERSASRREVTICFTSKPPAGPRVYSGDIQFE